VQLQGLVCYPVDHLAKPVFAHGDPVRYVFSGTMSSDETVQKCAAQLHLSLFLPGSNIWSCFFCDEFSEGFSEKTVFFSKKTCDIVVLPSGRVFMKKKLDSLPV
jgi:hypothetical protein